MSIFRQDESMSIFTLIPGVTPDDWDDYESGCNDQRDRCEHEARVLAFGAIRRAAAVARHHDHEARIIECASTDFSQRLAAEHFCLSQAIRRAIRAAIGSDKA